ncbi:3beta-hydroxysteroid-dehydrogenase/decarboxylase isoform 3 [Morus notabilis]|uniref:3beta-hydroxysteroid-dehydrogenase/decarboxylase isoform 3 n=1 Tax=Morus notabilis TaxID=981085 RepID=W9QIP3_9ROSA|nr:3beta-hydroxysteroid-dehydrogenase/decarboxylase isoform 3 [Morus notabilis]
MVVDDDRLAELNPKTRTCVVLGGRGFLGRSLVLRLLKLGKWIVRVADSAQSLELDRTERDSLLSHAIASGRASYHYVDVRDMSLVIKAVEGSSVVFYMDDTDLKDNDFYHCYMILFQSILNDLKAQAEALILFANDIDGLLTCAIRPCNVFGPGDLKFVPFFVNLARSGLTKRFSFQFIIGSGENMSDFAYVENVSHAHICAEEALDFRMASVAGKAFFISDLHPMKFWNFLSLIFEGLGYKRPLIKLPATMVSLIVLSIKWTQRKWGFLKCSHSAFHYIQLALCSRTFNCSAAQKHLGYLPETSLEVGSVHVFSVFNTANSVICNFSLINSYFLVIE